MHRRQLPAQLVHGPGDYIQRSSVHSTPLKAPWCCAQTPVQPCPSSKPPEGIFPDEALELTTLWHSTGCSLRHSPRHSPPSFSVLEDQGRLLSGMTPCHQVSLRSASQRLPSASQSPCMSPARAPARANMENISPLLQCGQLRDIPILGPGVCENRTLHGKRNCKGHQAGPQSRHKGLYKRGRWAHRGPSTDRHDHSHSPGQSLFLHLENGGGNNIHASPRLI